ncbi:hypothetical protein D9757_003676 [Collybiopsis confluens]|uniref:Uncharacterized protein n=1 Tax=Collybiopsis confluens TaxID=2823264 RepID=A0A8H5MDG4_9AGAR|nr:hypothetical protein D9757_003676 [Collybiopsis confluens]
MSSWARILQSPASRRTSSFFSSKAGGGRYFNSAKPPSAPAPPKKSGTVASPDSPNAGSANKAVKAVEDSSIKSAPRRVVPEFAPPAHPVIGDKDFKLHQFFSLDRPLLLLSNPSSILYSSPLTSIPHLASPPPPAPPSPETSPEIAAASDAEAARTLARAMAINHVGAASVWEEA